MLGSLDCMQTNWKNCPVEWQGYFKGGNSRKMSTIVLEAACDHNLWFWHASYGYPGSFNDINILQSSPLLQRLVDGSFVQTEQESGVIPFQIPGTERPFNHMFFLCDGIYPRYSRFIKTVKPTLSEDQAQFAQWQEGARKDIERAFGVMQCRWKAITYPIHRYDLEGACNLTACCLILHNMCVQDRVMGEHATETYNPAMDIDVNGVVVVEDAASFPPGFAVDIRDNTNNIQVGFRHFDDEVAREVVRNIESAALEDEVEWQRLQLALTKWRGTFASKVGSSSGIVEL